MSKVTTALVIGGGVAGPVAAMALRKAGIHAHDRVSWSFALASLPCRFGRDLRLGACPIGQRVKMGGPGSDGPWLTVVGVAGPTRYRELAKARATLYLPAKQFLNTARMLVVRSTASPALIASCRRSPASDL